MKPQSFPALLIFFLSLFNPFDLAFSADQPLGQITSPAPVSAEVLRAKIKEVEANLDLDQNAKGKLTNSYRIALSNLELANSHQKSAEDFLLARKNAPEQTRKIREELEKAKESSKDPLPDVKLKITRDTPLPEIEQLLRQEKANYAAFQAKLSGAKEQLTVMLNRPDVVQKRLVEAKQRMAKISDEIKIPAAKAESPQETEVRYWLLFTEDLALREEVKMLDSELLSSPMRIEILKAYIDQQKWGVKPVEARVRKLQERASERRIAKAEKTQVEAQVAQQLAKGKHPLVQKLAEKNAALSKDISFLATNLKVLTNRKDDVIKETERLQDNYQISKRRIELVGMSQVLGKAFAEQSMTLENLAGVSEQAELREKQIAKINRARIRYNDELGYLRTISTYVANLTADLSMEKSASIEVELTDLAKKRKRLLRQALTTQRTYLIVLNELDAANGRLVEIIDVYKDFLSKYLLWVRNTSFLTPKALLIVPGEMIKFFTPANWFEAAQILKFQISYSLPFVLLLALVGVILWQRKRLMGVLERTGKEVGKPASDRFSYTLQALGLTLLIAAPWPILLELLGWQLDIPESSAFTQAVSKSLKMVGPAFYFLNIFRVMSIPNGFAEAHLGWSPSNLQRLRFELRWFMWVFLPIFFIAATAVFHEFGRFGGELGRITVMTLLISIAVMFFRLLRPGKGIVCDFLAQHPTSFLANWHRIWFALVLALPLFLAGLTVFGYIYSSGMLFGRLYRTVGLISALVILYFFTIRWVLLVLHRKKFSEASGDEEPEIEISTLDKESHQLIGNVIVVTGIFGLWYTWSDVMPALGILDNIPLWYHTEIVSGVTQNLPVTLGDASLGIIILLITFGGLKHFSTFQEIVLHQFTSMRPSARYAFITLSSYAIMATGTAFVFALLGGSWQEIQWIFAALGVGIGFGLQEIVANFISGLIILFERPVRIGDVVTVGDVEGTVSRIQIRATTITMFDKKELLVPNKEFITGRLVNWSLSDPITRVMVYVQIAYGSDIQKTMSIMSKAAEENIWVLKSPAPFVTIDGFVDNRLKVNLRCYIGLIEHRLRTITALHEEIIRKFKEEGIVVPAPQRDLNPAPGQMLDIPHKPEE